MQSFDYAILSFYHNIAESMGNVLTPIAEIITLIGEKGLLFFALAFILMLFPKTRKSGVCIFGAVCCGALITNIILKDTIARPRPMVAEDPIFREWWEFIGSPKESGYSFPSGHATAAAAGSLALALSEGKKYLIPAIPFVALMCMSRNYLMAHYPTDVLAGAAVGIVSAIVAYIIAHFIFVFLKKYSKNPLFAFVLKFDIRHPLTLTETKKKEKQPETIDEAYRPKH